MPIEPAAPRDVDAISQLLADNRLPTDGVAERVDATLVARDGEAVVGCAALEIYDDAALLRSVAVAPPARGRGLGIDLTRAALDLAHRRRIPSVYLLTTTAELFFPRFGFVPIARADVPSSIRQSVEFRSACPETATVMEVRLPGLAGSP